jgi:hypothetical protein
MVEITIKLYFRLISQNYQNLVMLLHVLCGWVQQLEKLLMLKIILTL